MGALTNHWVMSCPRWWIILKHLRKGLNPLLCHQRLLCKQHLPLYLSTDLYICLCIYVCIYLSICLQHLFAVSIDCIPSTLSTCTTYLHYLTIYTTYRPTYTTYPPTYLSIHPSIDPSILSSIQSPGIYVHIYFCNLCKNHERWTTTIAVKFGVNHVAVIFASDIAFFVWLRSVTGLFWVSITAQIRVSTTR